MARVRIPDELRDRIRNYNKESGEYNSISDFASDAIRRLLDKKEERYTKEELKQEILEDIEKEKLDL
jgi:Arc/MetJ-type ribon-helix-helix transcriptional regulator